MKVHPADCQKFCEKILYSTSYISYMCVLCNLYNKYTFLYKNGSLSMPKVVGADLPCSPGLDALNLTVERLQLSELAAYTAD